MTTILDPAAAAARHIPASAFRPCAAAFVDQRNPNSEGKLNYSFIGPGVTQSDTQEVNMPEAHGFNVGGVTLPTGRRNNLHLHFTAEVFISAAGDWEFVWGNQGEHSAMVGQFDVFTIPTWIFRGFLNRSKSDDGFMFAVLGGDDTGGIVWAPQVLADAAKAGIRLTEDSQIIDEQAGDSLPAGTEYIKPVDSDFLAALPEFTPEQMEKFIIRFKNLDWRNDALPVNGLDKSQGRPQLAPALGASMTAARHHWAAIEHPHGFSIDWLRLPPKTNTGCFAVPGKQVAIVYQGTPQAVLNRGDDATPVDLDVRSIFSAPANSWREYVNPRSEEAFIMLVNSGDERVRPEWDPDVLICARGSGAFLDADSYVSPLAAIGE